MKQLCFGVDPTPVKASGLALSIGLEDRFKVINNKQVTNINETTYEYYGVSWLLKPFVL